MRRLGAAPPSAAAHTSGPATPPQTPPHQHAPAVSIRACCAATNPSPPARSCGFEGCRSTSVGSTSVQLLKHACLQENAKTHTHNTPATSPVIVMHSPRRIRHRPSLPLLQRQPQRLRHEWQRKPVHRLVVTLHPDPRPKRRARAGAVALAVVAPSTVGAAIKHVQLVGHPGLGVLCLDCAGVRDVDCPVDRACAQKNAREKRLRTSSVWVYNSSAVGPRLPLRFDRKAAAAAGHKRWSLTVELDDWRVAETPADSAVSNGVAGA